MNYLRVRNFEKFQHYKDRNPPWIKFYTALLDDIDFMSLPDDLKWPICGLFLLASKLDNKIPLDENYLKNRLSVKRLNLQALTKTKFVELQDASAMLATCNRETEERETEGYMGASAPEPYLVFGEFQLVRLTADEHDKLKTRLNGHTDDYINRLDRWGKQDPRKFAKRKSHYATILTWYDRDVKDGKVRPHNQPANRPGFTH